jgi:hypothetical protein
MEWYTAKCIFRSVVAKRKSGKQLCERRYFLVKADSEESAAKVARNLAKRRQHSYLNAKGARVTWIFEGVVAVKEVIVKRLSEGTEVYYEYFYRSSAGPTKSKTRRRARSR